MNTLDFPVAAGPEVGWNQYSASLCPGAARPAPGTEALQTGYLQTGRRGSLQDAELQNEPAKVRGSHGASPRQWIVGVRAQQKRATTGLLIELEPKLPPPPHRRIVGSSF